MNKIENLLEAANLTELLKKKEEKKKTNVVLWVFAIIGVVVAIGVIGYALYRYFKPDYLEDFEDEFEDDFEDEFDEDEFADESDFEDESFVTE
ncbi:MAG: DUF4366 domain-containing protein [Lachnospiraceae bacterium]|nr:DUF4366 domain-containing protein [Lachnospiraceae bacterium]